MSDRQSDRKCIDAKIRAYERNQEKLVPMHKAMLDLKGGGSLPPTYGSRIGSALMRAARGYVNMDRRRQNRLF